VTRLDLPAIVVGALIALGLIVPVALIARLISGGDDLSSAWNNGFTIYIMLATVIGAGYAGRRRPDTPMIHGAATGALTYLAARVVSAIASGEVPNIIALVFALGIFAALGAIGGFVATTFGRRSSPQEPQP
jgi:putative membrane protein (TIGR04086 family)